MKSIATTLFLICAVLQTACVPSINPFYTEQDLVMDAELVGTWVDKETGETWTFSNCESVRYSLVQVDADGERSGYDARLAKIEDKLFLDLVPVKTDLAPTHTFVHIIRKESAVQISYMEPRWLKDFLRQNPDAIRHEKINGEIVLTSSSKETQKFVLDHMETREAFSPPAELVRRRARS